MTDAPVALMACQRNEGIHLVEWVAYHRVIGFDTVILCSNDCQDGSDRLLDLLQEAGALTHLPNPAEDGLSPQNRGIRRVFAHLRATDVEWLAHLDMDEFLNIAPGAGAVQGLVDRAGPAHVIALPWRLFGDNGHETWPSATLPHFTTCEAAISPETVKFKSLFRFRAFRHANEHMPTDPVIDAPLVVNGAGDALSTAPLLGPPRSRFGPIALACQGGAQVNHYAALSRDVFLMKSARGYGSHGAVGKYHLNSPWHRRVNRNEVTDRSILARWSEVEGEMARLRALPGVAAAERACRDWFQATAAELLTPTTLRSLTKGTPA
jgi:hypothetical protein